MPRPALAAAAAVWALIGAVPAWAEPSSAPLPSAAPPAPALVAVAVPVASAARAKFPNVPGAQIDALAFINAMVNRSIEYVIDEEHYGVRDHWVMFPPDGKGDCEDYVLAKYALLAQAGFPTVTHARLRSVLVGIQGHAILELRMPGDGSILFMDNNTDTLMTRPELEAAGYRFFDW